MNPKLGLSLSPYLFAIGDFVYDSERHDGFGLRLLRQTSVFSGKLNLDHISTNKAEKTMNCE
jgi:hypothetical protein